MTTATGGRASPGCSAANAARARPVTSSCSTASIVGWPHDGRADDSRGAPRAARLPSRALKRPAVLICLALAALSLLALRQPTYDPYAWLIWGRQIAEGTLSTEFGPSWKPLPVLFTTPFALAGDDAAPLLWLVVARTGGLLALVLTFHLARRLAGTLAGVVAVVALALTDQFVANFLRGNSEGLLVALVLLGVERHLDGRRTQAFAFGVAAALVRPEMWLVIAVYGLLLVQGAWHDPAARRRALVLVGGCGVLVAGLWFVPEYVGSGDFLRGASRALVPVEGSPGASDHPALAVLENAARAVGYAVLAGLAAAVVRGLRARGERAARDVLGVAALAGVLVVTVALMAQGGFTGGLRYALLPAALACVAAGAGWAWLVRAARSRTVVLAVLAAVAAPAVVSGAIDTAEQLDHVRETDLVGREVPALIERAGGAAAVRRCGMVFTTAFEVQLVAYALHLRSGQVGLARRSPGTVIAQAGTAPLRDGRFRPRARTATWVLAQACG